MILYKDYTTEDLILNTPYVLNNFEIYPVLVKEYSKFNRYVKYLVYGKKHLELKENDSLLFHLIIAMAFSYKKDVNFTNKNDNEIIEKVIKELEELFSLVTHKRIISNTAGEIIYFYDEDNSIIIDDSVFNELRIIVQKMNLLQEPVIYDDPLARKWFEKARIANSKGSENIEFSDMVTVVSCETGKSYDVLANQNLFQLNSDYLRIGNRVNYDTTTLFKTVSNDIPNVNFIQGIARELYRDKNKDLVMSDDLLINIAK